MVFYRVQKREVCRNKKIKQKNVKKRRKKNICEE